MPFQTPSHYLITDRLFLKLVEVEDAELIYKLYNQPKFIRFIGQKYIYTLEYAKEHFSTRFRPQIERLGYGNFVIIRKEDGEKIGTVGIFEREGLDVQDIGFALLPEFEKKGYCFEAAHHLFENAGPKYGIKKLSAITAMENYASQKVIEKLGMKFIKVTTLPGEDEDLKYYESDELI